jgi:hypothetical protein
MQTPKWKLFTALWVYSILCWVMPYVFQQLKNFDVTNAFTGYPWNFSPVYAVSLFGGAYLANRKLAIVMPAAAYLVANLLILAITGRADWASVPEIWLNYALYALFAVFGFGISQPSESPLLKALGRGLAASLVFFLVSNFACFLMSYPHTLAGLADCYYMALPFFGPALASTLFFTAMLFSPIGVRLATQEAVVNQA